MANARAFCSDVEVLAPAMDDARLIGQIRGVLKRAGEIRGYRRKFGDLHGHWQARVTSLEAVIGALSGT